MFLRVDAVQFFLQFSCPDCGFLGSQIDFGTPSPYPKHLSVEGSSLAVELAHFAAKTMESKCRRWSMSTSCGIQTPLVRRATSRMVKLAHLAITYNPLWCGYFIEPYTGDFDVA